MCRTNCRSTDSRSCRIGSKISARSGGEEVLDTVATRGPDLSILAFQVSMQQAFRPLVRVRVKKARHRRWNRPRGIPGAKAPRKTVQDGLDAENGTEIANLTAPGAVISQTVMIGDADHPTPRNAGTGFRRKSDVRPAFSWEAFPGLIPLWTRGGPWRPRGEERLESGRGSRAHLAGGRPPHAGHDVDHPGHPAARCAAPDAAPAPGTEHRSRRAAGPRAPRPPPRARQSARLNVAIPENDT